MAAESSGPTMGGVSSITSNSSHMFMQHISHMQSARRKACVLEVFDQPPLDSCEDVS